jgi:hypothetical protein
MDSLLSRLYYSLYTQARNRYLYFKKPVFSKASSLYKTCLIYRNSKSKSRLGSKKYKPL